jgi:2-dehydropantoate 2-reductase
MRICFLGAGALGCAIGGTLTEAGYDVSLVDVNEAHVAAMNRNGLVLTGAASECTVPVRASTRAAGLGTMDLVVVLVKSFHTRQAIEAARDIVGPATVVMSLQNGLGHEDILAEVVGRERVIAGKTYTGGVMLAPGRVNRGIVGKQTIIGELDGTITERVRRIADAFNRAGLSTEVTSNIVGMMWDKLFVNVATGALAAITRLPYGELYAVPEIEATALSAVEEAMAVARQRGVEVSTRDAREAWLLAARGLPASFKTSMLQSLESGAVTEIDFINGAVVRHGRNANVPTPVNATLVACVKGIEHAMNVRQGSPAP